MAPLFAAPSLEAPAKDVVRLLGLLRDVNVAKECLEAAWGRELPMRRTPEELVWEIVREEKQQEAAAAATAPTTTPLTTTLSTNNLRLEASIDFWPRLREATHLQVCRRTSRVWGKKKRYQVYQLSTPLRHNLDSGKLQSKLTTLLGQPCRVYWLRSDRDTVWLQINLGAPRTSRWIQRGDCPKKGMTEWVAVIQHTRVALTASRKPSSSPWTPTILAAMEQAWTCHVGPWKDTTLQQVGELEGTDPLHLLATAEAMESGQAVGELAAYANDGKRTHPVEEMRQATSGVLKKAKRSKVVLPQRSKLQWQWTGRTRAAGPLVPFQAALTLRGDHVLEGLQALRDMGLWTAPPDYVRQAPQLGEVIVVEHGEIVN